MCYFVISMNGRLTVKIENGSRIQNIELNRQTLTDDSINVVILFLVDYVNM